MKKVKLTLNDGTERIMDYEVLAGVNLNDMKKIFGMKRIVKVEFFDDKENKQ